MGLNELSTKDLQILYLVINHFKFIQIAIDKNIATLKFEFIFCSYRVYPSNSTTSIADTTAMIATIVVVADIHSS